MTFREIAALMDPVSPPTTLSDLWSLHRFTDAHTSPSFGAMQSRFTHPGHREARFLSQNAWLMDVAGIPEDVSAAHKPATNERAVELGTFLQSNFDLILLQEVWETPQRRALLDGFGVPEPFVVIGVAGRGVAAARDAAGRGAAAFGPVFTGALFPVDPTGGVFATLAGLALGAATSGRRMDNILGSGLMMISRGIGFDSVGTHSFDAEAAFPDLEFFAEKGVLKAVVSFPALGGAVMPIELFTTHFYASGGPEGDDLRRAQVDELIQFIERDPVPGALRIVAGDFNIDETHAVFDYLKTRMEDLELEETLSGIWRDRIGSSFHTSLGEGKLWAADCVFPASRADPRFVEDAAPVMPEAGTKRIDFCFVERPGPTHADTSGGRTHSFDLDFSRPRRLRIRRSSDAPEAAIAPLVSDHLGIATTLFLSPR